MASFIGPALQIGGDLFGLFGNKPFGLEQGQHALDALQKSAIPAGEEATGRGTAYDLALLSGDPAAQAAATAPQVNAASGAAEAERRRIASEGTARGGGVNAALQEATSTPAKTEIDVLTALQPGAAGRLESTGLAQTGIGAEAASTETSNALREKALKQDFLQNILKKMSLPTGGTSQPQAPQTDIPPTGDSGIFGTPPGGGGEAGGGSLGGLTDIFSSTYDPALPTQG